MTPEGFYWIPTESSHIYTLNGWELGSVTDVGDSFAASCIGGEGKHLNEEAAKMWVELTVTHTLSHFMQVENRGSVPVSETKLSGQ